MLRQVTSASLRRCTSNDGLKFCRASYATKKRKLSKNQLAGIKDTTPRATTGSNTTTAATGTLSPTSGAGSAAPSSSGGGGMAIGALLVAGGAGGYYYFTEVEGKDVSEIPLVGQFFPKAQQVKEVSSPTQQKIEEPVKELEKETPPPEAAKEDDKSEAEEEKPVVQEETPEIVEKKVVAEVKAEKAGHSKEEKVTEVKKENEVSSDADLSTATAAAREIRMADDDAASETLWKAHQALRADLDDSLLKDLDELSVSELKVRVVQLATEMKDRTKWEAVRLKEFLAMKDKETSDKYMEILQKQRIEFEALMARRLLEVENELQRKANAALQEKENNIQAVVKAAADAQEIEHEATLKSAEERLDREINAKYEVEYETKLANEKATFVQELEGKVKMIEELSEKLRQLESSLQASLTYESGSQHAHRVSGAAMALAAKMETSKGAADELLALKAAAGKDGVIASALASVPSSITNGVPTLPELQAKFQTVYRKSRQAALVPDGWVGLDGQLMGILFATLKLAPSPDDPAPDSDKDAPEYLLARAFRHVQTGELERAVEQLRKLEGQAAFTIRDWKKDAEDRIAVEKALRVIKMECALLNESLSGGSGNGSSA